MVSYEDFATAMTRHSPALAHPSKKCGRRACPKPPQATSHRKSTAHLVSPLPACRTQLEQMFKAADIDSSGCAREGRGWGGGGGIGWRRRASLNVTLCCGRQVDVVDFVLMRVRNKHPSGSPAPASQGASGVRGTAGSGDDASFRVDIAPAAADGASMSDLEQLTYLNLTGVIKVSSAPRLSPPASYLPPLAIQLSPPGDRPRRRTPSELASFNRNRTASRLRPPTSRLSQSNSRLPVTGHAGGRRLN